MNSNLNSKILPLSNPFKESSVSTSQCSTFPNIFQYNDRSKLCFQDDSIQQEYQQHQYTHTQAHHKLTNQIDFSSNHNHTRDKQTNPTDFIQMQPILQQTNDFNVVGHITQKLAIGSKINEKIKYQLSQAQSISNQDKQQPRSRKSIIQQLAQLTGEKMVESNVMQKNAHEGKQPIQQKKPKRNRIFNNEQRMNSTRQKHRNNIFGKLRSQHTQQHPHRMATNNKIRPKYRDSQLPQQQINKQQLQRQFYQRENPRPQCIHAKCMLKAIQVIDKITNQNTLASTKSRGLFPSRKQLNSAFYKLFLQVKLKLDKINNTNLQNVLNNQLHSIEWLQISCNELKDRLVEQTIDQFKQYSQQIRKLSNCVNTLRKIQNDFPKWQEYLDQLKKDIQGVFYSKEQIKYRALKRVTQTLEFISKQLLLHQKNKNCAQICNLQNQYLFFLQRQREQISELKQWIQSLVGKQINFSLN